MEDREATMTRFLNDLNVEITNMVGLLYYVELKKMIHLIIKVHRQLKRNECTHQ